MSSEAENEQEVQDPSLLSQVDGDKDKGKKPDDFEHLDDTPDKESLKKQTQENEETQDDDDDDDPNKSEEAEARPDWLPEKFWKAGDGEDDKGQIETEKLAKSYRELEQRLSRGKGENPNKDLDTDSYIEKLDLEKMAGDSEHFKDLGEDDTFKKFADVAREKGIPPEVLQDLMETFLPAVELPDEEKITQAHVKAEMEKLGKNAEELIVRNRDWLKGLLSNNELSQSEYDTLHQASRNADFVLAMNKIRILAGEEPIAPSTTSTGDEEWTLEKWDAAVASDKYANDAAYRRKIDKIGESLESVAGYGKEPVGW